MKPRTTISIAPLFAALLATACEPAATDGGPAAQGGNMPAMPNMPATEQRAAEHMGAGTVNSIDAAAGTVNITHGPVATASWPAMTMTFKLADPSLAANVAPGAAVEFHFTIESGMSATVTRLSPAE
jgi:Cu(I)/Ag(I) efflux system membrane fusion protein